MSYRNDHDAALSRVDALEIELETLRLAYEKQQAQVPTHVAPAPRRATWLAIGVLAAVCGGLTTYQVIRSNGETSAEDIVEVAPIAAPTYGMDDREELRLCAAAIEKLGTTRTAANTDPHGSRALPVKPIVETGARCRLILKDWRTIDVDDALRPKLAEWARAEDELVGSITRTVIYYDNDPYRADNYVSAPQLWREYDRAIATRDAVLEQVRPML